MPIQATGGMQLMMPTQLGLWPGMPQTRQIFKVPTMVAYPSDPSFPPLWGFEAERANSTNAYMTYRRIRAFKTFLEPNETHMFEAPPGKSLTNVVHDFLQGVYQHLVQVLAREGWSTQMVDYQILFTVPAPFSTAAVEAFKRIVMGTGWANHGVQVELTEPEAAALYTLRNQPALRARPTGFQVCR
jgi:hypothetical protein